MKIDDVNLVSLSKQELIALLKQTEEKFADSNVHASELVIELEDKNEELEAVRKNLESISKIVTHSINEVYVFDQDTFSFLFVNNGAQENLGYSREDLMQLHPWDIKKEFSKEKFIEKVQELLESKTSLLKFQTYHTRKDGTSYPVDVQLERGSFEGKNTFNAIIMDRSREVEFREQMLQSARLASIGELAAGVGHEINNPLSIVLGHTHILKRILTTEPIKKEKGLGAVHSIESACERIRKIVLGLRTFARAKDELESVDVVSSLQQICGLISEVIRKEGIKFRMGAPEEYFQVRASNSKLQQAILNLVTNAIHATENNSQRGLDRCVEVNLESSTADEVRIAIADNGMGMTEEVQSKMFNPFYTTKPSGKGTGLGMGIVYRIVEEFSGSIHIESEPNEGTVATIILPRCAAQISSERRAHSSPDIATKASGTDRVNFDGKRILLLDDEVDILDSLSLLLSDLGAEVQTFSDAREALKALKGEQYNIIVTDLKMPNMDGFEFLQCVHESWGDARPAVLSMSGGVSDKYFHENSEALQKYSNAFLRKPFDIEEFIETLNVIADSKAESKDLGTKKKAA